MKVNCIIIDDDPSSVELVKDYLERFKEFVVVGTANNAIDALKLIDYSNPELIFLDINLPDISGINLMKSLIHLPEIIFISGSPEYAITAYEYDVVDYLLKPISIERFIKAINKYNSRNNNIKVKNVFDHNQDNNSHFFKLKVNNKTYNLKLDEIIYIESMREFIKIHYIDGNKLVVKYVLSKLDDSLPDSFMRIHKSYIVSQDKIKSFTNKYVEVGDNKISIGTVYKNQTIKTLSKSFCEV